MPSMNSYLTAADCERETDAVLSAAAVLYAGSGTLQKLRDITAHYLAEMRGLLANRGITAPTVGFIGDKDAGKSHLLRMLIREEAVKSQIPCGMGDEGRTEKLIWVGTDLPPEMESSAEIGLRLHDGTKQLELEDAVTLVDIPGFNDAHSPSAQRARELALKSCQVKVMVFDSFASTTDRVANFARLAPGPIIVPVLNRVRSAPDGAEARKLAAGYEQSIRSAIGSSSSGEIEVVVRPAVVIPDAAIGLEDTAHTLTRLVKAVQDAVAEVRRTPHLGQRTAQGRRKHFYNDIRRILEPDHRKVSELLNRIERATHNMPRELLPHLLGSEKAAAAGIRIWLRAEVLHRTPPYFFPLRSFIGLLALTSRAWDSLLLAMGGSIPSLFTTLFSIAGSARLLRSRREPRDDEDLERAVRGIAIEKQNADLVALRGHFDAMNAVETPSAALTPKGQIEGLSELRSAAVNSFERIIRTQALPKWPVHLLGWLSLAWCGLLLYGPLKAVYGHHLMTMWRAFHEGAALTWMDFPVPPVSTVMGWIVLAFLPVFAAALILQALAATGRRVDRCRAAMEKAIEEAMEDLTAKGVLALRLRDTKLDAGRLLFGKVFDSGTCH
jgi:hypothetical protein